MPRPSRHRSARCPWSGPCVRCRGRYSHEITKEEIEQYYHLPCEEVSAGIGCRVWQMRIMRLWRLAGPAVSQLYHRPCITLAWPLAPIKLQASRQLGIGLTILKRICRRLGIEK